MACASEPIPFGWKVWRGPVPPELVQLAIDVRNHIGQYAYGSIARTVPYAGGAVAAFKSHHTWTWRDGQLVTGLCIPGVSLLTQAAGGTVAAVPIVDSLDTPDPNAAVFAADGINWNLVAVSAGATVLVIGAFFAALHFAGPKRRKLAT